MDKFTRQYLETALWSSTVMLPAPYGISEDDFYDEYFDIDDFTEESIEQAIADCTKFQEDNADDLSDESPSHAGHDFWLTRNGHGAGFWDGDYEESKGDRLTAVCKSYGELYIWADNSGKLHFD
jgi:hypothetical protein